MNEFLSGMVASAEATGPVESIAWKIGVEVAGPAADDVDRESRFPHEAVEEFKRNELLSALVPEHLGGGGATLAEIAGAVRALRIPLRRERAGAGDAQHRGLQPRPSRRLGAAAAAAPRNRLRAAVDRQRQQRGRHRRRRRTQQMRGRDDRRRAPAREAGARDLLRRVRRCDRLRPRGARPTARRPTRCR